MFAARMSGIPPWHAHHISGVVGRVGWSLEAVMVAVLLSISAYFAIYAYLVHAFDPFHLLAVAGAVTALALAVAVAAAGAGLGASLLLVMLAPAVIVVGYEAIGHRHMAEALQRW